MTFSLYLGDSSVMACVGQNMFSSLTVVVDCFLSSRNSRRRFKISSLFCAYLSLSLCLLTSFGSTCTTNFSIWSHNIFLTVEIVVNYLGFARWLYPEMECAWKMTFGFLVLLSYICSCMSIYRTRCKAQQHGKGCCWPALSPLSHQT
jgi:uncharacterized membrane protein YecN with MAPEG domain